MQGFSWVVRLGRWGAVLASTGAVALACGGSSSSGSTLAGTSCDYECVTPDCNVACDGDWIAVCSSEFVWERTTNCAARSQTCGTRVGDDRSPGETACVDASSGGTGGAGGQSGGGGQPSTGGSGGRGGAGGGTSPGTIDITFDVEDRGAYCRQDDGCSLGSAVVISSADGRAMTLNAGWCPTMCDDCAPQPCPGLACMPVGVEVTGASLTWDGTFFESGTCGAGTPCVSRRFAPAGSYVAEFCATRGSIQTPGTNGDSECVASGSPECVSVEFDLPGSGSVGATLPSRGGSGGTGGAGGTGGTGGSTTDPSCTAMDSNGFFSSCSPCPTDNCDTISAGAGSRAACGCSSSADCPCGLSCGSYEIAPGISVGGICVR